jgi:competence protein ComEC
MILGGFALLLTFIFYPLGQVTAYFAWPFAAYTIRVVEWFASFPGGVLLVGEVSLFVVLLLYLALFAFTIAGDKLRTHLPPIRPSLVIISLGLLAALVWQSALNRPDGLLHISVLDVGTGDAILIKSPTGRYVLVGGGSSSTMLSDALGRRLPIFQRQLDFLVVSAPREEQVAALPFIINRFPPAQVLWAGASNASRSARFLQSELTDAAIPIVLAQAGDVLDLGGGAQLEVLAASRRGAVLIITWQNFRLLLPMGLEFEYLEESQYGGNIGPVTALLLADNGYAPLNPQEWIDNLRPQIILLGIAAGNYDGLPSQETLEFIQAFPLLRTDQNGWIRLHTDGFEFWVEVEK